MNILKGIENIIFDFGRVVFNIDTQLSVNAFADLGIKNIGDTYAKLEQNELFEKLEIGKINANEFRNGIRKISGLGLSDYEIDEAWNKMLVSMPIENITILKKLKNNYRIFLLSNTNEIHRNRFDTIIEDEHQIYLEDLFEKVYYSYEIGFRKPDVKIYQYVIKNKSLIPERTLFIDDSLINIEGAKKAGLKTYYFIEGNSINQLTK